MMIKKQLGLYVVVLGILGFTLIASSAITADKPEGSIQFYNDIPTYEQTISPSEHPLHVAYELQAIPFMEAGVGQAYRTDFIATIILAVDRDQVKDEITGWNCLRTNEYSVHFNYKGKLSHIDFGYTILSMMTGLDYDDSGYHNTIHLLRYLHNSGRLITDDLASAPIAILFDYQAAQLIKAGRNMEIIVPVEGTLSFPAGIMSTRSDQLPDVNDEELVAAGFRLSNGDSDFSVYPEAQAYDPVKNASLTPKAARQVVSAVASFQRQVLGRRRWAPANGTENLLVYMAFIIVIVLWSGLLYQRISDKTLQKKLFLISGLLLFWMMVRMIRLLLPDGTVDRVFWYLFYIPLTFLPTILFRIGQILTKSLQSRLSRLFRIGSLLISFLLTLLVLTNDYHQMAFRFFRGTDGNNYDLYYSYGWVYYFTFIWSLFLIFAFVWMVVRKTTESKTKQGGPLILVLAVAILYFAGYAIGVPILRESEFSIVYGMMSLLFLEVCFQSRLIPNNTRLGELLRNAPIDIYILSNSMQGVYKTNISPILPVSIVEKIQQHEWKKQDTLYNLSLPDDEGMLYNVYRISGGYSIFAQHLDPVIKLRAAVSAQNQKIKDQNDILARTYMIKGEIARVITQQELFKRITGVLKERVHQINTIFSAIPVHSAMMHIETVQKQLAVIKVLVNYCKRRGNLVLLEANGDYCQTDEIVLWIQESIWESSSAGVVGSISASGNTWVHSSLASLIYDIYQYVLEKAMTCENAVVLVYLSMEETSIALRIAVETSPMSDSSCFQLEQTLDEAINAVEGSYVVQVHDEDLIIQIVVPKGEEKQ